ncbi:hypothetical protein PG988_016203 [Apiospora saccharicola]
MSTEDTPTPGAEIPSQNEPATLEDLYINWTAKDGEFNVHECLRQWVGNPRGLFFWLRRPGGVIAGDLPTQLLASGIWAEDVKMDIFVPKAGKTASFNALAAFFVDAGDCDLSNAQMAAEDLVPSLSRSTGSEESLSFLKQTLIDCQQNHGKCKAQCEDTGWYPTRLVEVTGYNIRLIACNVESPASRYATLSHCWGGAFILKCTTENLEALQADIQYDSLPLTFQHAITTIRGLGIRYIWIDSLCIIQDSKEDWQTEAATMGDIYQHAVLNIAATHGIDSHAGLFTPQYPNTNCGVFRMNGGEEVDGGGIEMIVAENLGFPFGDYWKEAIEQGSLNQRGWVLQERLLSARKIHFAHGQAFWDCAQLCAWEMAPRGGPGQTKAQMPGITLQGVSPLADLNLQRIWLLISLAYPRCKLTFPSDKLVALSGIAKTLATRFGDQYHQGLWRTDMEKQLCWEPMGDRSQTRIDQIPSWSWASLSNTRIYPASFYSNQNSRAVSIVDVSEDSMQIRIRCPCYSFTFTSDPIWNLTFGAELVIPGVLPAVRFGAMHDTADLGCGEDWLVAILYSGAHDIHGLLLEFV